MPVSSVFFNDGKCELIKHLHACCCSNLPIVYEKFRIRSRAVNDENWHAGDVAYFPRQATLQLLVGGVVTGFGHASSLVRGVGKCVVCHIPERDQCQRVVHPVELGQIDRYFVLSCHNRRDSPAVLDKQGKEEQSDLVNFYLYCAGYRGGEGCLIAKYYRKSILNAAVC